MSFRELMNDRIIIVRPDGSRSHEFAAAVSSNKITFDEVTVDVTEGDTVERKLPGGRIETYEVLEAHFSDKLYSMPAMYSLKVRKTTSRLAHPQERQPASAVTVYNLIGANPRVNVNSTDSSVNVVDVSSTSLFEQLEGTLRSGVRDEAKLEELLELTRAMKAAQKTPRYQRPYQQFIATAADHMTLILPFVPALSQLLPDLAR